MCNRMVVYQAADLSAGGTDRADRWDDEAVDRIFRALADATRRDILRRTLTEALSVSVLAEDYEMSFSAVQKHVTVLESAGLVDKSPHGRERLVRGDPGTLHRARLLLDRYAELWRHRVDRLDALLAEDPSPADHSPTDHSPSDRGTTEPGTSPGPTP